MTDTRLPEILHPALADARERVEALLSALDDPRLDQEVARSLPRVWVASEFVARQCERDPELVRDIVGSGELMLSYVPGLLAARLRDAVAAAGDDIELGRALRRARNREMVRIAWRDLAGWATLEETLADRSDLAGAAIDAALTRLNQWHRERFGVVRGADHMSDGRPADLIVLGMGKLGAHELNFSSDVDLIFAFAADGESDGGRVLGAEEYFLRLGQRLIRAIDEVTPDGFVERVDMRLRPFGEAGPLVMSAGAMETYYQVHGREWERYALIKARPVAGDLVGGERLLKSLKPFVFRRYLDYGVFDSLREMKGRISGEVARRGMEQDIKLGRGGIREVEFIGQCFQLIRGGRDRRFQERSIQRVLTLLGEQGSIPKERAGGLLDAYRHLRQVENRLQQWGDQQVHVLPSDEHARARLAWSMGCKDWDGLLRELDGHRGCVQRAFEETVVGPRVGREAAARAAGLDQVLAVVPPGEAADPALAAKVAALGYDDPPAALAQLARLRDGPAARVAAEQGRRRLAELAPTLLTAAARSSRPLATLTRLVDVVESLARRSTYLALLAEMPAALTQLTRLCAASGWIAELVARQPVLLDELIDPRLSDEPPRLADYAAELSEGLALVETVDGAPDEARDEEGELDALREFKQAATLRVAAADVGGALPLMKVSDHLTEIAECAVRAVLEMAWRSAVARHGVPRRADGTVAPFAVVAYGKLGGWELGYGSDLDLVFLHDAGEAQTDGARAVDGQAFCMRLGQRIIHLLTTPTASGILYEVDTRLRPEGMKGSLVTSLSAFERYQREEAWTWEHQALLRARAVAGDPALRERFAAVRRTVLSRPREPAKLKSDVLTMRERMRRDIPRVGEGFDLKGDPGGITDLEFLVQHRVLLHAATHPSLLDWPDVIRFLEGLAREGLMPTATAESLADAYRALRGRVHAASLQGDPAVAGADDLGTERALVERLWAEEFGGL